MTGVLPSRKPVFAAIFHRLTVPSVVLAVVTAVATLSPSPVLAERSPEDTVRAYLKAMQEHRFSDAYDCVSSTLRRGQGKEEWSKEQQYIVEMGEVKIFGYKVFDAVMVGDKARVPNILKSQDKYLNQLGLDEHEVYDLVREEGQWRIDQQTLVEGAERREFFPEE
jgi:hypothetical protein